jgi:hypothetical protein
MPAQADPLAPEQVGAIKKWIEQGAIWDATTTLAAIGPATLASLARAITPEERSYWAFQLPVQSALPMVDDKR